MSFGKQQCNTVQLGLQSPTRGRAWRAVPAFTTALQSKGLERKKPQDSFMPNSLFLLHFLAHFFKDGTVLLPTSESSDPLRNKSLHTSEDRHCLKHGTESYPRCPKESHKLIAEISKDPVALIKN